MVSPQQQLKGLQISSPTTPKPLLPSSPSPLLSKVLEASTPNLRNGGSSLSDDAIWKRLREAGFDEESIKRRDKAALITYITKLESEIYDYQHHLGLLLLERKEWAAKYEQVKIAADSAEAMHKRDQAAHFSALAEARKREENLKKALGVEKLCVTNIEKALHEMRAESAETKLASESKLAEARTMIEDAQQQLTEAEAKFHAAESMQAEASRYHSAAERKLHDVEAREDALRRRMLAFKSECDAKEKEINLERQCLNDRQQTLQQGQERLVEGQALLNQREEQFLERSQKFSRLQKELETEKVKIDKDLKILNEEKSTFDLKMISLASREEAAIKRETLLEKKEQELLVLKEKIATKEYDEIQRLTAAHEAAMEMKKSEFEAELELKRKLLEDELATKRQACELKESDLNYKEEEMQKRVQEFEILSIALADKENDIAQREKYLYEKEQSLKAAEEAVEAEKMSMQKEREEIIIMKLDLKKSKDSLEAEKNQVVLSQEKLEITQSERNELLVLQTKLKEEIDSFRAQKLDLMAEVDELKAEKEKFENEWQLIDEKREELQKEAERVAEERKVVSGFLKNEQESLKSEKDALRDQFKHNVESLACEREAFMSKMEHDHSVWFSKIQKERMDFLRDIDLQKSELENSIDKRREEIERCLREKEEAFEQEKASELQYISSRKELVSKELEHVATEMKRLQNERINIALDREQREKEWSEIKNSVGELQIQREKLQKQRELLHAEREEIQIQIQQLKELVDLKITSENMAISSIQQPDADSNKGELQLNKILNVQTIVKDAEQKSNTSKEVADGSVRPCLLPKQASGSSSPPVSTPLSWVKKCAELIFKSSPEKDVDGNILANYKGSMNSLQKGYSRNDKKTVSSKLVSFEDTSAKLERPKSRGMERRKDRSFAGKQPVVSVPEESKVIFEVPSVAKNVKSGHGLDGKTSTNKRKVVQHKDSSAQNASGGKSILTNNVTNLFARRKRGESFSSYDDVDVLSQIHKKTRQDRDATETFDEVNTPDCVVSAQMPSPEVENCPNSSDREDADDSADENHEISEIPPKSKNIDDSTEQAKLICSQKCTSDLHHDCLQVGGSNGGDVFQLVENGVQSPSSHQVGQTKAQKKASQKDCLEVDEEPVKEFNESFSEVITENYQQPIHAGESKKENSDGDVDADEDITTVKEKFWKFLIT